MLHLIWPSPTELGWPLGLAAPNRNRGAAAPMVAACDIGDSGEPGGEGGQDGVEEDYGSDCGARDSPARVLHGGMGRTEEGGDGGSDTRLMSLPHGSGSIVGLARSSRRQK
jgi:hypothetical protein